MSTIQLVVGHLTDTVTTLFAAAPDDPTPPTTVPPSAVTGGTAEVSSTGITGWLQNNALPVVLLIIGLFLALLARKGETSKVITVVSLTLISLAVIAVAVDATLGLSIGRWLINLIFNRKA